MSQSQSQSQSQSEPQPGGSDAVIAIVAPPALDEFRQAAMQLRPLTESDLALLERAIRLRLAVYTAGLRSQMVAARRQLDQEASLYTEIDVPQALRARVHQDRSTTALGSRAKGARS